MTSPSRSNEILVIDSIIGILVFDLSVVCNGRGIFRMRGRFISVANVSLMTPVHKHPLSTRACTIVVSLIIALTRNGSVIILVSLNSTTSDS